MSNTVNVVKGDKGYKVLVNYIQEGVEYSTKELAEEQATQVKAKYNLK